jgi:hypothetical protein
MGSLLVVAVFVVVRRLGMLTRRNGRGDLMDKKPVKHAWILEFETSSDLEEKTGASESELIAEVKDELENFFPFYNIGIKDNLRR